jgi:hypothetical protein
MSGIFTKVTESSQKSFGRKLAEGFGTVAVAGLTYFALKMIFG